MGADLPSSCWFEPSSLVSLDTTRFGFLRAANMVAAEGRVSRSYGLGRVIDRSQTLISIGSCGLGLDRVRAAEVVLPVESASI